MKILSVLLMVFCLSWGYVPSVEASSADNGTVKQDMQKHMKKGPMRHRAMSMAMMKDLNLSDEQKSAWKDISAKKKAEIEPLREQIKSLHDKEEKINEKYEAEIRKILTEEQLSKYENMLSERPHNMPRKRKE